MRFEEASKTYWKLFYKLCRSVQEAIYLTLQIPLARATRQVVFINTSPPEKRTFLLKQTSVLEKMSPNSTDIESDNDINRYSKRPEVLANLCLADYISQLEVKYPQKNDTHQDDSDHDNSNRDEYNEGKETEDGILRMNIRQRLTLL